MRRRHFLLSPLLFAVGDADADVHYPAVERGAPLRFPRDHGAHRAFRTEWWYLTAIVGPPDAQAGVQITFFRSRPGIAESGTSRFAPTQLLFAHAALALPDRGRLLTDQRAARAGFGLAEASELITDIRIDDWTLALREDTYVARIAARDFAVALDFKMTQPPVLHGDDGVSRKGPRVEQASYYYSVPQLAMTGTIAIDGVERSVAGIGWLDHEWSSAYLAAEARGWDWCGINFDDGGALMAFRIRDRNGNTYWAGGTHRDRSGRLTVFGPSDVQFSPLRRWRSPRTNVEYPVSFRVSAGSLQLVLEPVLDDQEEDARASVGTIYWEGAVRARRNDALVGSGYLELTGYGEPLRL
jgi:predicted secreted hydrolase